MYVIPIFFSNNNPNYAKWLPVHLRDMLLLDTLHPNVAKEFNAGKFVIQKTGNNFTGMAYDPGHE